MNTITLITRVQTVYLNSNVWTPSRLGLVASIFVAY